MPRPGLPKKPRAQGRLRIVKHERLDRALKGVKPKPLQSEPRWFRDLYVKVLEFFGLRKAS